MKIVWKGKFDGNVENLPHGEHKPGAVKFKEIDDPKKLGLFLNLACIPVFVIIFAMLLFRTGIESMGQMGFLAGCVLSLVSLVPHEFLHAICFREEAQIYTNFKNGMLFVVGTEDMSKSRFIFMSMLPNLVFGFLPFLLCMIFPSLTVLGALGALSIGMGIGDYYNVFHALTQMPKGARTYLYGFNSWWYLPEDQRNKT
ncbi:DUF3267 domain-containing protein [uncultured Ruminococcus sp.]|uniref:DUF3267 domain-containing protein n=1 Tax=uncultured Ruminococcus sp. TaxID=165186 RepID=UPI00261D54A0|nr:DUF3267 domain-containing protein [uncultured Ruminococcus sp.]